MLEVAHLSQIMRHASHSKLALYAPILNEVMPKFGIDNLARVAAFIAQLAHESGEFLFMEEIWGPTDAQKRYEPPGTLATRLGNTQKGDGRRFKGRGPIQVTGRANYERYGSLLGLDLVGQPELAATPEVGFAVAGTFWQRNGLNALADAGDFTAITRRINGGQNGAAQRVRFHEDALRVLRDVYPATLPATAPASVPVTAPAGAPATLPPGAPATSPAGILATASAPALAAPRRTARSGRSATATLPRGAEAIRGRKATTPPAPKRVTPKLDARPDTMDFRDQMYIPTLVEVPTHVPLGEYVGFKVPILDQGSEGACTGYGLATVANYLLLRRRVIPDSVPVSPRMLYDLARRYDEWPGETYSGSSARGAMKGWHKHGVCPEASYPSASRARIALTDARTSEARKRPLGAYFRVNHKDLVAMHTAIAEVGVLFATATVHAGWEQVGFDGAIEFSKDAIGGHAFAIVAYDDEGFWVQNSWGTDWGRGGFARVTYDDWLKNGTDVWVARLGAPVKLHTLEATAAAHASTSGRSAAYSFADLRPHIVSVGNEGKLSAGGDYGTTSEALRVIFEEDIPRIAAGWKTPRILLYAHGGLVSERSAVQRLAEYRPTLLDAEVYPLAFIWHSDFWTTLTNALEDALRRRRPEGVLDAAKDFLLDRLDDALEPLVRKFTGKLAWDEIKENALAASNAGGAATKVVEHLKALGRKFEVHLISHSAGSIVHARLVEALRSARIPVASCTLWAPACTVEQFKASYVPSIRAGHIRRIALYMLNDVSERADHCANIYHKSLLYLVSNALEGAGRKPDAKAGVPILGMEQFVRADPAIEALLRKGRNRLIIAPSSRERESGLASGATHHGDFDDDEETVIGTFAWILDRLPPPATPQREEPIPFRSSSSALRDKRVSMDARTALPSAR